MHPVPILADRTASVAWRLRLLADIGAVIAESLDFDELLRRVATLTLGDLGDLCAIDLLDGDGSISGVAAVSTDPSLAARVEEMRRRHPLPRDSAHPVPRALREGVPRFLPELDEILLGEIATNEEHRELVRDAGYRSAIVVPLRARGRTFGAFSVLRMQGRERFVPEDFALVEEIARCTALALDNAVLHDLVSHSEKRLKAMLGELAEAVIVQDSHGRFVYLNGAATALFGSETPEEVMTTPPKALFERFEIHDERGYPLGDLEWPGRVIRRGETPEPVLTRVVVRATGQERWLFCKASALRDEKSGELFSVTIVEDVTALKRNELVQGFLNRTGEVLSASLDHEETLQRIANLAVPELADWCLVDLLDGDGEAHSVAVAHLDPARLALALGLRGREANLIDPKRGLFRALSSSEPILIEEITERILRAQTEDPEHLELLRKAGLRSGMIVPMRAGGRVIGALTFMTAESGRTLTQEDVPLAQIIADRAALAVEHARAYRNNREIARTLQRELLPAVLPEIPGWEIAALYSPAGEENEVGGDFYDVFGVAEGWIALMGDVTGKGVGAATLTALVRHTARAVAEYEPAPARVLERVDASLRREPGPAICSAICARLEEWGVALAIGGHPLPLKAHGDGGVTKVGAPEPLLGAFPDGRWTQVECELGPEETLLLYTDGVTDTVGEKGERFGSERLRELLATHRTLAPEELVGRIDEALGDFSRGVRRDDVAVLALSRRS
jgi:PAS domain S-box-containing protein